MRRYGISIAAARAPGALARVPQNWGMSVIVSPPRCGEPAKTQHRGHREKRRATKPASNKTRRCAFLRIFSAFLRALYVEPRKAQPNSASAAKADFRARRYGRAEARPYKARQDSSRYAKNSSKNSRISNTEVTEHTWSSTEKDARDQNLATGFSRKCLLLFRIARNRAERVDSRRARWSRVVRTSAAARG
jgi:hypothetical protein